MMKGIEDETKKTVKSIYPWSEHVQDITVPEFLLEKSRRYNQEGKTTWITDSTTGESFSYANFDEETKSIASALYKKGMRKNDILIYMPYDLVKLPALLTGVWRANGIVRALYPEEDEDTIYTAVEENRVGWIYCDPEQAAWCLAVANRIYWDVEVIISHGNVDGCTLITDLFHDNGLEVPDPLLVSADPAMMLCTSGTTGKSKSAVHTHQTVIAIIIQMGKLPWSINEPNLILSKATHVSGTIFPFVTFARGLTSIVMPRIKKEDMFQAIQDYKPGFVWGFPTLLLQLANESDGKDLSSLKLAATGGAACTPAMKQSIMQQLPNLTGIICIWGLTETLPLAGETNFASRPYQLEEAPEFSIGKVAPGVELQCRDSENGNILGPNTTGELCVKSQTMISSYWMNQTATQDAFVDGLFRTGDIGYYDENGYIFLVDRLKDIFKYQGNHVAPTEIEDVLSRHSAVSEVCVVGVPDPEGMGSVPRAFVVKRVDFDHISADDIKDFAHGHLADYKYLRGGLHIVETLPKGKTGKITRALVQQLPV